jgi:hypothetical protein
MTAPHNTSGRIRIETVRTGKGVGVVTVVVLVSPPLSLLILLPLRSGAYLLDMYGRRFTFFLSLSGMYTVLRNVLIVCM